MPVVSRTSNDIVLLPLEEGTQFSFISTAVDNVGNRKPLDEAMEDVMEFDFPVILATCPSNCSDNGNCTTFGFCICEDGYYGDDCSQGKHCSAVGSRFSPSL